MEEIHDRRAVHQIGLHLVWCPKYRHQILVGLVEAELRRIIGEICGTNGWKIEAIEIMPDHVHLFLQIDPWRSPADIARTIKGITAIQLFTLFPDLKRAKFWGSGMWSGSTYYGGVGQINDTTIRRYIENQKGGRDSSPGQKALESSP